ncbi:MAG: succinylglutamate desuccinylase/aspartoacylase family protein [Acidimicrobiales bacterium]
MIGAAFDFGQIRVDPGTRHELELRPARLPSGGWMAMPVVVVNGAAVGPTVWLSAALHGDEINGVEIIRRVLELVPPATLAGTVLAVPVVNIPGFATADRYMPDRRDLNRCFPGSARGSLASRFAHLFMTEIVERCSFGLDLHTGSDHRCNLPQIRADLDDPATRELAAVFGAPVAVHSRTRDGSLREAAVRRGIRTLLYEGGEAWRFDDHAIEVGVTGTLRVLAHLGMIDDVALAAPSPTRPRLLRSSRWLRSPMSGLARIRVQLGDVVQAEQTVAVVGDAIGAHPRFVRAREPALVIARSEFPVVHQGDALVHLAPLGDRIRSNQ